MEHSNIYRRRGFQSGNILGDPFALATTSIGFLAWLITFVGCIIGQIQETPNDPFPKFSWWASIFSLFLIIGVFYVVGSDTIQTYHVALTGYSAGGMVLVTSSVNSLVYSKDAAREAAAAGFILLSMVVLVWTLYFGSTPSATPRAFLDSFALTKESAHMQRQTMSNYGSGMGMGMGRPETSNSVQPPQMYTSAQLNGFENPSPVGGASQMGGGRGSQLPGFGPAQIKVTGPDAQVIPPTEYPYRAKAIYSYKADPKDGNEISFELDDILEVSDVSGRWWQARNKDGQTGIAPSNYLELL
ncbi:SHO1 osmosensor [Trichoderma gamsii]|uniref:SHO1 osmosensor n=1 Tax=Trichoderma gamsii TaxID=398673 RepID=A0A0W7W0F1_9HYPO|nr:SHO1 osmosensor [Trichoderma gamsii]PNP48909.1 hypothetical protein TGAMA5MH_00067 [Trichoderma gamsii]PON26433.1 SHO1 osmosensor [Trichoderma gamsii]